MELQKYDLIFLAQAPIKVFYEKEVVDKYYPDLVVESKVILELKTSKRVVTADEDQLTNYLKATNIEVGLLLKFGKKPQFRRKIFTNNN